VRSVIRPLAAALVVAGAGVAVAAPPRMSTTCAEDDPVPTPAAYIGWERSSVVAWNAIEEHGGIVPDIEEDRGHAPPAWWRYPSPLRSAELLADEARNPKGLYTAVAPDDLRSGDLVVRARGAGACGKMAMVAGLSENDRWVTIAPDDAEGEKNQEADPTFFDGKKLRPEASAYRISIKQDSSLGHARELDRDLAHLERTIGERPPLVVRKGRGVVDEKVHDLVDEAASLAADPAFDLLRRPLTGRALALAAALDWPGAAEAAAAVLDDALRHPELRADAAPARTSLYLLGGQYDKALELGQSAAALPGVSPRIHYLVGRALLATGKREAGLAEVKRFLDEEPGDPRARKLIETGGREPALDAAPAPPAGVDLGFSATADHGSFHSQTYGFDLSWPIAWRVVAQAATPENLIVEFATERVLRDDGEAERGSASLLVQHPEGEDVAAQARKGARIMFPDAKLKTLPPLLPGSKREQFREQAQGSERQGEVTTLQRNGAVYYLVLNASAATYPKLKDEYAAFVKSLGPPAAAPAASAAPKK